MEGTKLVSSLAWISRGFAKKNPKVYIPREEEVEEMKAEAEHMKSGDLGLEGYDQEMNVPCFTSQGDYDMVEEMKDGQAFDESEDEKEDYLIQKSDALLVAGKIDQEFAALEVYVYEEDRTNLYVHHDILLSAFPLAIEWLNVDVGSFNNESQTKGNYAIVGSFIPEIEIWDLDLVDAIEPTMTLGGEGEAKKKKRNKPAAAPGKTFKPGSHTDCVISLNLNPFRRGLLCSGSADETVKLWDLGQGACVHTYYHHTGKVQSVKWNPREESILMSGGFDKKIHVFDVREPTSALSFEIPNDLETAIWDPHSENRIIFTTEAGELCGVDPRNTAKALFEMKAHNRTATSVCVSPGVPGLMATTSLDGTIKVWDINGGGDEPLLVKSKKMHAGKLYCASFYQDSPWILACGSSKGEVVIWDTRENLAVVKSFIERVPEEVRPNPEECNKIDDDQMMKPNTMDDDDEDDDDDMDDLNNDEN